MRDRRFTQVKITTFGRIGHPGAIDRKLVPCAGVRFEDRQGGQMWTMRKYEAYPPNWPAMDVWTVQTLVPVKRQGSIHHHAYSNQQAVDEAHVPDEVKAFAIAELVKLRLRGKVRA